MAAVLGIVSRDHRTNGSGSLGAIAVGSSVALASTRVWPIPPEMGPAAPKVWLPEHAEPSADGSGLTIVVNPDSGNGDSPADALRKALPQAVVKEVEIVDGDEIRKAFDDAIGSGAIALGVCGGDGTINTAAQIALDAQKALVVFPGGTFNHFTGALGIETIEEAVEAVRSGEAVGVDVATIDGRVFLNTASFGSYTELVDARERLERRYGKWPAVVIALLRVLRTGAPVDVEIDGHREKVWMAFIGNCRYHPSGFAPSWRERLDDELLDLRYVSAAEPYARTRLILAVLTGRLGRSKIYRQSCPQRLEIKSLEGPLRLARDGETFEGSDDIVVEKLDKRLAVYVPHTKKP
jgi:undecaprenyl-diphosphatase